MRTPAKTSELIANLSSSSAQKREIAVRDLARLGADACPDLAKALTSRRWLARRGALLALAQIGDADCLPQIRERIGDDAVGVRHAAIQAVGRLGDRKSLDTLHGLLTDGPLDLCPVVIEALAGIVDPSSTLPLCAMLEDGGIAPHWVPLIVWALGEIGSPSAVSTLCIRSAAFHWLPASCLEDALVGIGTNHPDALLSQLATGESSSEAVVGALYRLGEKARSALSVGASGSPSRARWCARIILAAQGHGRLGWLDDLCSVVSTDPNRLRLLAAAGLQQLAKEHRSPELRTALPSLRNAAAFWWNPPDLRRALRAAIAQIELATKTLSQMPLPVSEAPDGWEALPRITESLPCDEGLPLPAAPAGSMDADGEARTGDFHVTR